MLISDFKSCFQDTLTNLQAVIPRLQEAIGQLGYTV